MANRDALEWLDTANAPTRTVVWTDLGGTPITTTLSAGEIYFVDSNDAGTYTLNLPEIGGTEYGKRIVIYIRRSAGGLIFTPQAGEFINSNTSMTITDSYLRMTLIAVPGGAGDSWLFENHGGV